jgi:hypothetical protein
LDRNGERVGFEESIPVVSVELRGECMGWVGCTVGSLLCLGPTGSRCNSNLQWVLESGYLTHGTGTAVVCTLAVDEGQLSKG